jgi:predicted phosphodiesterase
MSVKLPVISKALNKMGLTEQEAVGALKSLRRGQRPVDTTKIKISRKSFSFGYFSDAHIGSKYFQPELFAYMVKFFQQENPDFILNSGDHLEGMSGRPGHVYELSHIGFAQQLKYAVELYSQLDNFDHYGIDGNHDMWFYQKNDNGVVVGEELQRNLKRYHHLGQSEGNLEVSGVKIQLYHGGDGTAYATSYKLQKLIESFSNGMKPNIVLSGHYHKALYMFSRGVHGLECGTLCGQTGWMRGKKIPAHMGFGLVRVFYNHRGVERFVHEFTPWYEV